MEEGWFVGIYSGQNYETEDIMQCVDVGLSFHRENCLMEIITNSTVCRLAFIMQPTFSLHLMQCQTTGTTTDNTSTITMPL